MATAIDPVCNMDVDTENPSGGQSEYQGTDYYFCAPGCKVAFGKEPGKYLGEECSAGARDHGHEHDRTPDIKFPEKKPGLLSRLFWKK